MTIFTTEVLIVTDTTEIYFEFLISAISGKQCFSGFLATIYLDVVVFRPIRLSMTRMGVRVHCERITVRDLA